MTSPEHRSRSRAPSAADTVRHYLDRARPALQSFVSSPAGHLGGIAASAQSFVLATVLASAPRRRVWVVCRDLRQQERVHAELESWGVSAHFLPDQEVLPVADAIADPELAAERLHVLAAIAGGHAPLPIVLTRQGLDDTVPPAESFRRAALRLDAGREHPMDALLHALQDAGYTMQPQVFARGQFAVRGGIVDIFSWQAGQPLRLEYFGDTLESLREFDLHSQTTSRKVPSAELILEHPQFTSHDHIPLRAWLAAEDLAIALGEPAEGVSHTIDDSPVSTAASVPTCHEHPVGHFEAGDLLSSSIKHEGLVRSLRDWQAAGWHIVLMFQNEAEQQRFDELLEQDRGVLAPCHCLLAPLAFGFHCPDAGLVVLSAAEILGRYPIHQARRRFSRESLLRRVSHAVDAKELEYGDPVVHADYGIAIFRGLGREAVRGGEREVMLLEYADDARLFVPLDQAHLVSRYVGVGGKPPTLSKLGEARWSNTKKKAEKDIRDYAAQLLRVQAARETLSGHAHAADTRWQWEFENAFPYRETTDQLKAIRETKKDMESSTPMDRLICGDVGFGKTEVAIRAAFKAVMGGTQVAILVPTTVLAQQHYDTFRQRMSGFPVRVELLCRLQSEAEQQAILADLATGAVDIVVGTHRVVSPDVAFANLGLVVIDEEQRFGVKHKERFKDMFRLVDVLTLSATPIPRTLYMSLVGLREMSTIDTPPPNRLPVTTMICPYDERVIRNAIQEELRRGGQVFYLHNRVGTIDTVRDRLAALAPGARVLVGHGQMDRHELEEVMHAFVRGDADILVATTIIESGIDIPNANTILIDRADLFGLADLYQLRGRVGRSGTKAYAYLMLPRGPLATGDARKRLNAMREYSALGSGFKVAMRDLEIRGAGSLLGLKQSGHIANIGFDLYCQLLRQSVAQLSGHTGGGRVDVALHSDFLALSESEYAARPGSTPAYLPTSYIAESSHRVAAYRALAECTTAKELRTLTTSWRDRFGPLPPPVSNLADATALKIAAAAAKLQSVEIRDRKLMLYRGGEFILVEGKFPRLQPSNGESLLQAATAMIRTL